MSLDLEDKPHYWREFWREYGQQFKKATIDRVVSIVLALLILGWQTITGAIKSVEEWAHLLAIAVPYASLLAVLAVWKLFPTSSAVYRKEHSARLAAEKERDAALLKRERPDLVIKVLEAYWQGRNIKGTEIVHTYFYLNLRVTNREAVDTRISTFEVAVDFEGKTLKGVASENWPQGVIKQDQANDPFVPGNEPTWDKVFTCLPSRINHRTGLKHGIPVEGWIAAPIDIHHINAFDSFDAEISVTATDSFEAKHSSIREMLKVRHGMFAQN